MHVPPGGYAQSARRFLEIFQKHEIATKNEQQSYNSEYVMQFNPKRKF